MELRVLKMLESDAGFSILPVHYSHDPDKDEEWRDNEIRKYRRDNADWQGVWDREMELDFSSVPGALAYPSFSKNNLRTDLRYNVSLPLCLCMDFNVEPMIWEISQTIPMDHYQVDCYIGEIKKSPGCIEDMVTEFRNRFPDHQAGIYIYGDVSGSARSSQSAKSNYDLVRLYLRGYPSMLSFKVPLYNPLIPSRLNAVNLRLRGAEGQPLMLIDPVSCPELVRDFSEVKVSSDGLHIVKTKKRENPYFWRTHASDAAGYKVSREWPVVREVNKMVKRRVRPISHGPLLGDM